MVLIPRFSVRTIDLNDLMLYHYIHWTGENSRARGLCNPAQFIGPIWTLKMIYGYEYYRHRYSGTTVEIHSRAGAIDHLAFYSENFIKLILYWEHVLIHAMMEILLTFCFIICSLKSFFIPQWICYKYGVKMWDLRCRKRFYFRMRKFDIGKTFI